MCYGETIKTFTSPWHRERQETGQLDGDHMQTVRPQLRRGGGPLMDDVLNIHPNIKAAWEFVISELHNI